MLLLLLMLRLLLLLLLLLLLTPRMLLLLLLSGFTLWMLLLLVSMPAPRLLFTPRILWRKAWHQRHEARVRQHRLRQPPVGRPVDLRQRLPLSLTQGKDHAPARTQQR